MSQDPDLIQAQKLTAQAGGLMSLANIIQWGSCLLIAAGVLVPVAFCVGALVLAELGIW